MRLVSAEEAAALLRSGQLVVVPTETVYGLAARADSPEAVRKIFVAKGRPASHPLIVHVPDRAQAARLTMTWSKQADGLARHFWPGPLTLVLPKTEEICSDATAGGVTVGVRVPDHPLFQEVLRLADVPIAAPSANRFTKLSPTRVEHLDPELLEGVAGVLDGGPCAVGIESTVLDLSVQPPVLLRAGGISLEQIRSVVPETIASEGPSPKSPGQHPAHYQPRKRVRLETESGPLVIRSEGGTVRLMPDSPTQYAQELYAVLHELDQGPGDTLWVSTPPNSPEWEAIWDRLRRAIASDDS